MGILGMLIFVPLSSVLYALVKEFVLMRLREKGVAWEKYGEAAAETTVQTHEREKKQGKCLRETSWIKQGKCLFI